MDRSSTGPSGALSQVWSWSTA